MIERTQLQNRQAEPKGAEAVHADLRRVGAKKGEPPPATPDPDPGQPIAARLATARAAKPRWRLDDAAHCGHCLGTGWDQAWEAALRIIDEGASAP